jgi:Cu-Zn family superoxide dismutase
MNRNATRAGRCRLGAIGLALTLAGCHQAGFDPGRVSRASALLTALDGSAVQGELQLVNHLDGAVWRWDDSRYDRIRVHLEVSGAAPGRHGVHLYDAWSCDRGSEQSAVVLSAHGGANADPAGTPFAEARSGDLPNLHVDEAGRGQLFEGARAWFEPWDWRLGDDSIFDVHGRIVVLHERPDDHVSQPIGGAGRWIACGVIEHAP